MKRFFTKRWHGIPVGIVTAVLLVCIFAGSAFAAVFTLPIPSTVNVVTVDIAAYSDADCTEPLTEIVWGNFYGEMARGTDATQKVYIKYIGTASAAQVTLYTTGLPDGVTLTWTPGEACTPECYSMAFSDDPSTLVDERRMAGEFVLTLHVGSSAPIGPLAFSINFTSDPTP